MVQNNDVLIKLETAEINELKNFYATYKDDFPHIFSFLKTTLKWRQTHPEYITIFSVEGDWNTDGTFIALLTFSCYDIILHSLDDTGKKLHKGLSQTKLINWFDNEILFYATHEKFKPIIFQALSDAQVSVGVASVTHLWQIPENNANKLSNIFEHEGFYLAPVKPEDAEIINSVWPPRYPTSLEYLRIFIKMNGGYGIYEKETNKLVSWLLVNVMGQLGVLQTRDGYFKNGFGAALTRITAKVVAQNGDHPIGTVHDGNIASERVFGKVGFEKKYKCIYIRCNRKIIN